MSPEESNCVGAIDIKSEVGVGWERWKQQKKGQGEGAKGARGQVMGGDL